MEIHIELAAFALIGLIVYTYNQWAVKGDFLNPAIIYALINGGMFIVFAFGPYVYKVNIPWYYYYLYVLITIAFVIGIRLGEKKNKKWIIKDIKLNRKQLFFLSTIVLLPIILQLVSSGIFSGEFTLEDTAFNRLDRIESQAIKKSRGVNLVEYILSTFLATVTPILATIFLASSLLARRYLFILIYFISILIISILGNSRTLLLKNILLFIIPYFIIEKNRLRLSLRDLKFKLLKKKVKLIIIKNIKIIFPVAIIVLFIIPLITNIRSEVVTNLRQDSKDEKYGFIENLYVAEKKAWFSSASKTLPENLVNPVAELSLYAGGTVASGGVISRIASETGWHTWGLRYFFSIHRILAQLKLDVGFSDSCREAWYKLYKNAMWEVPAIGAGWLGDPGNIIVDFGYFGAPLVSLITGWLIGWMYSRFSNSGSVIQSIAVSVLSVPMLISPAFNFFGSISNLLSYLLLLFYFSKKSYRMIYQKYLIIIKNNNSSDFKN
jgi:hypothetical protein